jgi:hypothetical protein
VIANPDRRWIVIGEVHGSAETPRIFADAVCLTADAREKVVVALEQPSTTQEAIDVFIGSDGGPEARRAFLQDPLWSSPVKDGRSSQAYFALFETLRQLRTAGRITSVIAIQPVNLSGPSSPGDVEKAMAAFVQRAAGDDATVVTLVGNSHARLTTISRQGGYQPMAANLPAENTVSLNVVDRGGQTWSCTGQPVVCGPNPSAPGDRTHGRGVDMTVESNAPFSGVLYLGSAVSASPPQV